VPSRLPLAAVALLVAACGDNLHDPADAAPGEADAPPPTDGQSATCQATIREVPLQPGTHFPPGKHLEWTSNPPATGPHYSVWAKWSRSYAEAIPRGYWVHNLEHGGVLLLHHCPDGCADDVAALEALAASLDADPKCTAPRRTRTIVTPDPELPADVRIAAAAWGWTYTAPCLDVASLRAFVAAHYAHAPEDTCAEGGFPLE